MEEVRKPRSISSDIKRDTRSVASNWRARTNSGGASSKPSFRFDSNRNHLAVSKGAIRRTTNRTRYNSNYPSREIDQKVLEKLLTQNAEDMLLDLLGLKFELNNFIKTKLTSDTIVLLIEIYAVVLNGNLKSNFEEIAKLFINDVFINRLQQFIMHLPMQERENNTNLWKDVNKFWENLNFVCEKVFDLIPPEGHLTLVTMVKGINYTIPNFENNYDITIPKKTKQDLLDLGVRFAAIQQQQRDGKGRFGRVKDPIEGPPNDFHSISIYPLEIELRADHVPYVRKNLVDGKYTDVNHYLDVQFRLLREDFVAPLREGITEYLLDDEENVRLPNVKIYKNVRCLGTYNHNNQMGYKMQVFKPNTFSNIVNTKRLIYGSLVCFTTNDFLTLLFGKIIESNPRDLRNGVVIVGFDRPIEFMINATYTMLECMVYFEPYSLVLQALKNIKPTNFPFKNYLVDLEFKQEIPPYIQRQTHLEINNYNIKVGNESTWPTHTKLGLNESQLKAFKMALNNKLCVIQGPPGTGKTFIGLKIAETLLKNCDAWRHSGPILVICYTNHALDQFLEGILKFTTEIVRVGGQSKCAKLDRYNIKEIRTENRKKEKNRTVNERYKELKEKGETLKLYTAILNVALKHTGVLKFHPFFKIDPYLNHSWFISAAGSQIVEWLFEEALGYEVRPQFPEMQTTQNVENAYGDEVYFTEHRQNNYMDIEDDFLGSFDEKNSRLSNLNIELISFESLSNGISKFYKILRDENLDEDAKYFIKQKIERAERFRSYLKYRMDQLDSGELYQFPTTYDLRNPFTMHPTDRWRLYAYWLAKYLERVNKRLKDLDGAYRKAYEKYNQVRIVLDARLLRDSLVIGMTTTGAARLQNVLRIVNSPIVFVEEAAEVLEAHIVSALTPSCQHLILIGDHKQLRPSTADYNLEINYNLGISLFERLVNNGLECSTLNVQHRMRKEIAALVSPSIYPVLHNHESVEVFPEIKGVNKSLFFINHNHPEAPSNDNSKSNSYEVAYLLLLAKYLVQNGYAAEKITLLAAYSGQMFKLLKERRRYTILENLNITVLDNYQGEENEIILLSLVRNNRNRSIGFLSLENRVCVALSRAKHGMFIMGNIDLLCNNSKIWQKIREVLENSNSLGETLLLCCQNHPDQQNVIRDINDFSNVPEGGCMKNCGATMECGHICKMKCHVYPHSDVDCKEACTKVLCDLGHTCQKLCYQECGPCKVPKMCKLACGHDNLIPCRADPAKQTCLVKVPVILECTHEVQKYCYEDKNKVKCKKPCDTKLEPCGHLCGKQCHLDNDPQHLQYKCQQTCNKTNSNCLQVEKHKCKRKCSEECSICDVYVTKQHAVCNHSYRVKCHEYNKDVKCNEPCKKLLQCGHRCKLTCGEDCGPCTEKVVKKIEECGHKILIKCIAEPKQSLCQEKCDKILPCGHKYNLKCSQDSSTVKCTVNVATDIIKSCGHKLTVPCHLSNDQKDANEITKCQEKCTVLLECGHRCKGTCGECSQGRIHKLCQENCNKVLVCGHVCSAPCGFMCQPCMSSCLFKCPHSKCNSKCGVPCTDCRKPCTRKCKHDKCSKKCFQKCDVMPCKRSCDKTLKCGHRCNGFCGDICPPLCKTCDANSGSDSKYVYLNDCKHVVENDALEDLFKQNRGNDVIALVRCPTCKTPIVSTQRYYEYVKPIINNAQVVNANFYGDPRINDIMLKILQQRINEIRKQQEIEEFPGNCILLEFVENFKRPKEMFHQQMLSTYLSKLEIYEEMKNIYSSYKIMKAEPLKMLKEHITFLIKLMYEEHGNMNDQKIIDFELELKRLNRLMQLANIIENSYSYLVCNEYNECHDIIFSPSRYDSAQDNILKEKLETLSKKTAVNMVIPNEKIIQIRRILRVDEGNWQMCLRGHFSVRENSDEKCMECELPVTPEGENSTDSILDETDCDYSTLSDLSGDDSDFESLLW